MAGWWFAQWSSIFQHTRIWLACVIVLSLCAMINDVFSFPDRRVLELYVAFVSAECCFSMIGGFFSVRYAMLIRDSFKPRSLPWTDTRPKRCRGFALLAAECYVDRGDQRDRHIPRCASMVSLDRKRCLRVPPNKERRDLSCSDQRSWRVTVRPAGDIESNAEGEITLLSAADGPY
jgi:hypothetical protein